MEKSVAIIERLASSLGRRDEIPNQELASEITEKKDTHAVKILIENLSHKKKDIQSDCIKVLYEIGEKSPELIAAHFADFLKLLTHKNNRLQWGAMAAIDSITSLIPNKIFSELSSILEAAENGSVITRDHAVNVLIKLSSDKKYKEDAFPLLLDQMLTCPTNQLPMYAERSLLIINNDNKAAFIQTLKTRLPDIEKESKRKRVEKLLRKIN